MASDDDVNSVQSAIGGESEIMGGGSNVVFAGFGEEARVVGEPKMSMVVED